MSVVLQNGPQSLIVDMDPNTTLAEALQQFCKKFSLDPRTHKLSKDKRNLDLSVPWRLTGFVNRCVLTVSKSTDVVQEVNIGLQLPAGGRVIQKFPSNLTLWEVLLAFEQKSNSTLNLTTSGTATTKKDPAFYQQPAVLYMSKEICTNTELRSTTLGALGLVNGNGLLKFYYKPTTLPLDQFLLADKESQAKESLVREQEVSEQASRVEIANKEVEEQARLDLSARSKLRAEKEALEKQRLAEEATLTQSKPSATPTPKPVQIPAVIQQPQPVKIQQTQPVQQPRPQPTQVQRPRPVDSNQELQNQMMEKFKEAQGEKPQPASINAIRMELQKQELAQLQARQKKREADLAVPVVRNPQTFAPSSKPFSPGAVKLPDSFFEVTGSDVGGALKKQKTQQEQIFKSKAESKMEREQIYDKYRRFYIRIRFPDKTELQAEFSPHEVSEALFSFVEDSLAVKGQEWYLYTAPPMVKLERSSPKTFLKLGYLPAVLIHLGHPEGTEVPRLNEALASQIKEKVVTETPMVIESPQKPQPARQPQTKPGDKKPGGTPAWFKGPGKK